MAMTMVKLQRSTAELLERWQSFRGMRQSFWNSDETLKLGGEGVAG
jgi:hypothetical protein